LPIKTEPKSTTEGWTAKVLRSLVCFKMAIEVDQYIAQTKY